MSQAENTLAHSMLLGRFRPEYVGLEPPCQPSADRVRPLTRNSNAYSGLSCEGSVPSIYNEFTPARGTG